MTGRKRGALIAAGLFCAAVFWLVYVLALRPVRPANLSLQTPGGRDIPSEELLQGKMTLLNFWATWCGPCIREMPMLDSVYALLDSTQWQMYLVSEESAAVIRAFSHEHTYAIPFLRHTTPLTEIGVYALPKTIVLDREGHVAFSKTGAFSGTAAALYARLKALE